MPVISGSQDGCFISWHQFHIPKQINEQISKHAKPLGLPLFVRKIKALPETSTCSLGRMSAVWLKVTKGNRSVDLDWDNHPALSATVAIIY